MYLKKIEAQGFKSFANKTILEFNPGIMGIVGPNGSGKSNVVDAVRWVLGEQSAKQLRGSNMQDVIFAGTATRKPQGYAYITLTIDNADHALPMDFDDIIVTRRVYRSGESEYLINGNACRLRDIHELFYDTGVGKEGYSIIGQGQIDKILSTKPEDRRELFDEAAGIVKYKKRKDIAVKKLQEEQNNLVRVTDILNELEKQVGPIKQQAETAKAYLKLKEELKTYEVGAFHLENEDLRKKLVAVNEKLEIAKAEFEKASEAAEKMKAEYEDASAKRNALDKQVETDKESLSAINVQKESLEGRIKVLEEQVGTLKAAEEELKERLKVLDAKHLELAKQKEVFTNEKGELNTKLDEIDEEIEKTQGSIEDQEDVIRQKEYLLEQKQSGLLDDIKSQADISADSQGIAVKLEQAESQKEVILSALKTIDEAKIANKAEEGRINDELAAMRSQIRSKDQASKDTVSKIEGLEQKHTRAEIDLNDKRAAQKVAASKLETLKNMAERYDGYGESIKKVMDARKSKDSIRGVVADIISVEKKYETAIETALGGHIQNVVTKDEATAKEMVEYLKTNKLGRVTFLPMDAVKGRELDDKEVLSEAGIIDTANHLLKFDEQYSGIIDRLLGRILVAESITNALQVAKKYKYRLHIVTLEGEYLAPGGSITGGAFKNSSNLLSRKREIKALEENIVTLEKEVKELADGKIEIEKELIAAKEELKKIGEELSELKVKEGSSMASLDAVLAEGERLSIEEAGKQTEQQELLLLITDLTSQVRDSELAAKEAEEAEEKRRQESENLIGVIESERNKLKELTDKYNELKLEYSKLEERDNFLVENIDHFNKELDDIDNEKRELLIKSDPEGLQALAKEREKEKLVKQKDELAEAATELADNVEKAVAARDAFISEQKTLLEGKDENIEKSAELDKELIRLTNQQERINDSIESQANYLWEEYEMTPIEAEAFKYEGEESLSSMRKTISEKKSAIKELGPVNINAIDDEKEISERYEFLSTQHEDLVKARDSILDVITDLEEGMRKQFEEKFAEIKDEFDRVFKELFGGGKGTLELLHEDGVPDDVLKSGISIIAQPPGKKLGNMMQLSGGEKALTAIALIFAIQNLKPSPFCILDEVEAALDETNVYRFANYLTRIKDQTQLITITHKRGTMECADKLYGITMQEKGISTIVSVSFEEAEKLGEED